MLREELAIGSNFYSFTFIKKINSDGLLHASMGSQHGLLY